MVSELAMSERKLWVKGRGMGNVMCIAELIGHLAK